MEPNFWSFVIALVGSVSAVGGVATVFRWVLLPRIQIVAAQATAAKQAAEAARETSEANKTQTEATVAQLTQTAEVVLKESNALQAVTAAQNQQFDFYLKQTNALFERIGSLQTAVEGSEKLRMRAEKQLEGLEEKYDKAEARISELERQLHDRIEYEEAVDKVIDAHPDGANIKRQLPPKPNGKHHRRGGIQA